MLGFPYFLMGRGGSSRTVVRAVGVSDADEQIFLLLDTNIFAPEFHPANPCLIMFGLVCRNIFKYGAGKKLGGRK